MAIKINGVTVAGLGVPGKDGKSPYQVAVENGYTGTEAEFYAALVSLKDAPFLPLSGGTMEPGSAIFFGSSDTGISSDGGALMAYSDVIALITTGTSATQIALSEGQIIMNFGSGKAVSFSNDAISVYNLPIKTVGAPQDNTDAATKGYVDTAISSSITSALEASY